MSSNPPAYSMSPPGDAYSAPYGPPRWSALAITAFVLSFIGFFGFTAILGIILGVAGIFATRGAQRRGRGLAIASIPISILTGLLGLFVICGVLQLGRMWAISQQAEKMLAATDASSAEVSKFYGHCSQSFQQAVSEEKLKTWLNAVHQKHGSLAGFEQITGSPPVTKEVEGMAFHYQGKFTNVPALVDLRFKFRSLMQPEVDDIEVDGVSPRPAEKS